MTRRKNYSKQVLINGIIGLGFTVGAGVLHTMGNSAYEKYKESGTMKSAVENWDKVKLYDNIRNVCAIGALAFLSRAIYYQLKNITQTQSSSYRPVIDLRYAEQPKIIIGVNKIL